MRNRKREIWEKLPAAVDDLHIKEFKNKVHLPAELEGRAEVKLLSKEIEIKLPVGFNSYKFAIEDLKHRAAQKDLSYFLGIALQIQSDGSDIVRYIDDAKVTVTCSNIPASYKCCVVYPKKDRRFDLNRWGESSIEYAGEIYIYEDGPAFTDVTQGFEAHDFVLCWKQKYGAQIGR